MKPERKKHYTVLDHTWFHGIRPLCRERRTGKMVIEESEVTCRICLHFIKMRVNKFQEYQRGIYGQ